MCISEKVFGKRFFMLIAENPAVSDSQHDEIERIIKLRKSGFPLQYILGEWEFYGLPFKVGQGVLIPRADTETLVDCILENIDKTQKLTIADLCAGSGAIAIALAHNLPLADVCALELSPDALIYLNDNIRLNNSSVKAVAADVLLCETAAQYKGLDVIVSNPPYLSAQDMTVMQKEVTYEPKTALFGGEDGLLFYREITKTWRDSLAENGKIFFEVGMGQHEAIAQILESNGFHGVFCKDDYNGITRVVAGKR